ncbi:MAG: ATP:cob(I)alamin adenosyltransferase, partial [Desulfurococcales archaeon]|nr:ATP:cob(I)alamin adenosyltransferase [Desulfurococcales archaeon]
MPKDHPLIEFVGTLDEAISSLGMAASFCRDTHGEIAGLLTRFQRLLFNVGFLLSGHSNLSQQTVEELESIVDKYMEGLDLKGFIIPGGSPCSSTIHLARSITRRAERRLASIIRNGGYGVSEDKLNLA